MDQFDREIEHANERAKQERGPRALAARYDRDAKRIVIELSSGGVVTFSPERAQGLQRATSADLAKIEITPSGYGLYFPKLDADLWLQPY